MSAWPVVTCRVCSDTYDALPDAILVCPACRHNIPATRALVAQSVEAASEAAVQCMMRFTLEDLRSYRTVMEAEVPAVWQGGAMRFRYERQLAELKAKGGMVARYVTLHETSQRTRAWAAEIERELDELEMAHADQAEA